MCVGNVPVLVQPFLWLLFNFPPPCFQNRFESVSRFFHYENFPYFFGPVIFASQVYKQKVKHLLYEHQNNITTLKADGEMALKLQQDEFQKREEELQCVRENHPVVVLFRISIASFFFKAFACLNAEVCANMQPRTCALSVELTPRPVGKGSVPARVCICVLFYQESMCFER